MSQRSSLTTILMTMTIGQVNGMKMKTLGLSALLVSALAWIAMKKPIVWNAGEKDVSTELFDSMIDDLRSGETIVANFDTGLKISVNYETITIEDDEYEFTLSEDSLHLVKAFLNLQDKAIQEPMNINYDKLLTSL